MNRVVRVPAAWVMCETTARPRMIKGDPQNGPQLRARARKDVKIIRAVQIAVKSAISRCECDESLVVVGIAEEGMVLLAVNNG